jgi:hypothetical protein
MASLPFMRMQPMASPPYEDAANGIPSLYEDSTNSTHALSMEAANCIFWLHEKAEGPLWLSEAAIQGSL